MEKEEKESVTWLKYMMDELDVDVTELAKKIGKDARQVQRYRNGEFPKNKNAQKIKEDCFKYLCEKARYETYHHIENRIFKIIFRKYFHALSNTPETAVTQQEMADFLKISQKTISTWLNPEKDTRFSTELQYQILNFLFSRSMKYMGMEMYGLKFPINQVNNFDYLGYYAINQESEYYLKSPVSFFYLMQNGNILSEVDTLMIDYIDEPLELYLMITRQFEVAFRYAKYLPAVQQSQEYINFSCSDFDKFLTDVTYWLKNRENITHINGGNSIVAQHKEAIRKCPFLNTQKDEISKICSALLKMKTNPENEKEKDYQKLYRQLMHIVQNAIPVQERRPKPEQLSIEETIEKLGFEKLDIILNHITAFFDTIDYDKRFFHTVESKSSNYTIEYTLFYPFMKKMLHINDKEKTICEMETVLFGHKFHNDYFYDKEYGWQLSETKIGDKSYKGIKTMYRTIENALQVYLTMSKLSNPENRKREKTICYLKFDDSYTVTDLYWNCHEELSFEECEKILEKSKKIKEENEKNLFIFKKNAEQMLIEFPEMNLYEFLVDKLEFSPEDWHLWGLVQIGMRTNPEKMIQKIIDFMETPHEILVFSGKK